MSVTVDVRKGSIYLSAAVCETYFRGLDAVIVIARDDDLHILPVRHMASGGCLLKVRNAAGDRVASAPDVFHDRGLEFWSQDGVPAAWSSEHSALVIELPISENAN